MASSVAIFCRRRQGVGQLRVEMSTLMYSGHLASDYGNDTNLK